MESRIQSYLRAAASQSRVIEHIGPFLASFHRHSAHPYLNYAIPDNDAKPTPGEVASLIQAYRERNLKPRLEYISGQAPAVEAALLSAGFVPEGRLALMICPREAWQDLPASGGIELLVPTTEDDIRGMISAQNEAYGGIGMPDDDAVQTVREMLANGGFAIYARDAATREPAGGGAGTAASDGATEIAGIGVRPSFRRRGIAAAMTSQVTRLAFEAGIDLAFLTPASPVEGRIYARAGFQTVGDMLHISFPDPTD